MHRGGAWEGPKQKESTWALRSIIQKGPKAQGLQWGTDIPVTRIYFSTVGPGKNGNPLPLALVNESFELMMHPWLNGREFEQTLGDGEGKGGLACCSPWGR